MPQSITYQKVKLNPESFFGKRQKINVETTIPAVWARFSETYRVAAVLRRWPEGVEKNIHKFWDSDIAKWMESVAYVLYFERDAALEAQMEELIDALEAHQLPDGYLNCCYDEKTRLQLRDNHELYCAGHYIEAAVAYYEATGRDRFLKVMCKCADFIDRTFRVEGSAPFVTAGHEEIELALLRLYRATKEERYLALCGWFLDKRGNNPIDTPVRPEMSIRYSQDYAPVREQREALGHAVRANHLYIAMADYAKETGDAAMLRACEALYRDITERKMYVTGSIGSAYEGESFTIPYDLPNARAYAETCAAISLLFFSVKMWEATGDVKYQDTVERTIYNGILSGISLSGDEFFYVNPLRLDTMDEKRYNAVTGGPKRALRRRPKVFRCSCCPPNLTRLMASLGGYAFGSSGDVFYVNQFFAGTVKDGAQEVTVETAYPFSGKVTVKAKNVKTLKVRVPGWLVNRDALYRNVRAENGEAEENEQLLRPLLLVNGPYALADGYLVFENPEGPIEITFDMTPALTFSDARVTENTGKCAVTVGPVVYCAEGCDNEAPLSVLVNPERFAETEQTENETLGLPMLAVPGYRAEGFGLTETRIRMIPYFAFANREESDMAVWLPMK